MHRPSSLPMLAQCACYESSGGEFADLGTQRHKALQAHYNGDDTLLDKLAEEDQDGIRWAADYIRANSTDGQPLEWEVTRQWTRPDFSDAQGTPDVVNGLTIFDFKWRSRDYTAQMADYAMSLIHSSSDRVTVHLLYGAEQRAEKIHFDSESCERIILPILQRLENNPQPTPCDYCHWCAKQFTCKALTAPAKVIAEGYAEPDQLEMVKSWRPSEMMTDAQQMALGLTIWRRLLKKWGESVEYHAMESATKQGLKLPGYELKPVKGRQFIADVKTAYEASGLSAEEFLATCDVRLNTSKKYPDRKGLDVVFKEKFAEPSLAAAKRRVQKQLEPVLLRGKDSLQLKAVKSGEDDGGEE